MARTWLSVRVDLVSGRGGDFWPRPGRIFAAAPSHTFAQLSHAIDTAFARWDLAHMHMFTMSDGTGVTALEQWDGDEPDGSIDSQAIQLSRLALGEQFAYVFDFGDDWAHLCTVEEQKIDPHTTVGFTPGTPTAYWGWGDLPDQYGRTWDTDDGESPKPKRPSRPLADLPPVLPGWGPARR
ncbi:hypothetical protein Cs7R123_47970 [Catellatospora sp. TT07R-123]|uniref:IS1096 element passenger TnpR family protein n=1 Tax=Catellatospora sp. TT07R-123 TaxID=2733863 RepID=UPI001B0597CD|nr:hypothetical protein [Catellatospora sp. TT07R-123]GHJ43295.1 hypothetical protein Cs7R123_06370 [Catellatospora sp. TT07R-123]GHJ47439.1 hypothetical protein Cs7R123_47810 [Catellatospora sp. TT07R-123]GHJ47455.1 hypothetical protein Cs7R123_47970 [Catellatospora sp. TT07R-123]